MKLELVAQINEYCPKESRLPIYEWWITKLCIITFCGALWIFISSYSYILKNMIEMKMSDPISICQHLLFPTSPFSNISYISGGVNIRFSIDITRWFTPTLIANSFGRNDHFTWINLRAQKSTISHTLLSMRRCQLCRL